MEKKVFKKLQSFFYPLGLTLSLGACQDSGVDSTQLKVKDIGNNRFNTSGCKYSPFEGPKILSDRNPSYPQEDSGFFGKALNLNELETLLPASGNEILKSIKRRGVEVYKILNSNSAKCKYFAHLNPATKALQKKWDDFDKDQTLLGLFIHKPPLNPMTRPVNSIILLREDAQKWTLLHELIHYLFALSRAQEGLTNYDYAVLEKERTEFKSKLEAEIKTYITTESNIETLVESWKKLLKVSTKYIRNMYIPFEEFATEALLLNYYISGDLTMVDPHQTLASSLCYMKVSGSQVREKLKTLLCPSPLPIDCSLLKKNRPWEEDEELEKLMDQISELNDFIKDTISESENFIFKTLHQRFCRRSPWTPDHGKP